MSYDVVEKQVQYHVRRGSVDGGGVGYMVPGYKTDIFSSAEEAAQFLENEGWEMHGGGKFFEPTWRKPGNGYSLAKIIRHEEGDRSKWQ
jgi:hypothetical protein